MLGEPVRRILEMRHRNLFMKKSLSALFIALMALEFFAASVARAGEMKFPADKDPAFDFMLTDGWITSSESPLNLTIISPHQTCRIGLSIVTDQSLAKLGVDDIHKAIFASGGIADLNKKEKIDFAGKKCIAYYGQIKTLQGVVSVKLILIKLDKLTVASVTEMTAALNADDKAGTAALLASMKFTAGK